MASCRLRTRKNGTQFYEIRAFRSSADKCVSMTWDVPSGWSSDRIQKELSKVANKFEEKVKNGEILTRQEVKEIEKEKRSEAEKNPTVKQYIETVYMPEKSVAFAENTRDSYQRTFDNHIIPAIGDKLIKDVTTPDLRSLLVSYQKSGKSHASCIKLYNILNSLFDYAETGETIDHNPVSKKIRPKAAKDEEIEPESEKALSADDLNYVLECVKQEPTMWQAFIMLAADTGLRRGEECGLQWTDINFKQKTITVRRNAQYSPSKGIYVTTLKNKEVRKVDIGEETCTLLKALKKEQKKSVWVFTKKRSSDIIFPTTPTLYYRSFGKKYNIENFHPHTLRHTSASIAITNGADVASVADRLGHKDPSVTLRMYTHANEESTKEAGQAVRDALDTAKKKAESEKKKKTKPEQQSDEEK